ncbi:helix-turn-helix transcriptional regulator [Streptomyces sp. NPDC002994]|uniref:helix-turn-helix transcriptional regulator n=1 Tax=Streptomyces sp. NPDC002994 TaxID=3154441 RepID=UPI0033AAF59F
MTPDDPHSAYVPTSGSAAGEAERRSELGAFLRLRRERITPEEAGIPPGTRRRTPGLRREEVAQLSGIGVAWYTWLEQGRRINPSVQVLDAIARTLRLDRTERDHLYRLADIPSVPLDASAGQPQPPEQQTILDALTPLPASIVTARYDVLAFNDAYAALDPGLALLPPADRNVLWHLFTAEEHLQPLVEWEREISFMVAQLRAESGRRLGDPHWTGFIRQLTEASGRFAEIWARHEVASSVTRRKSFWTVDGDEISVIATGFALASAPDTKMWIYTPGDPETEGLLGRLVGRLRELGPAELLRQGARTGHGLRPAH